MIGSVCRVTIGVVMLWAGALKLRDPAWRPAARAMGVPDLVVGFVAPAEIILGAMAVAGVVKPVTMVAILLMLIGFTIVLIGVMGDPERPSCACFGRWSNGPIGWTSVARNVGLVGLGVVALVA